MTVTLDAESATFDGTQARQSMRFTIEGDAESDTLKQLFADGQTTFRDAVDGLGLASYEWPPKTVQALPATGAGGRVDWSSGVFVCATPGVA